MRFFIFLNLFLLASSLQAQCLSGNCDNGKGTYKYSDGTLYAGTFKNKKCDGLGKITDASGDVYEGEWKNNLRHGSGVYKWANGDVYEGTYENNVANGIL
jgi:hypothetical protein